jgi:hypothetical protein
MIYLQQSRTSEIRVSSGQPDLAWFELAGVHVKKSHEIDFGPDLESQHSKIKP